MKLFIGNLPYNYTEEDLKSLFSEYSPVSCKVIFDRDTQRSKGFGFIELSSKEVGEEAIGALNGKEIEGRAIVVNEARPQEKRTSGGGGNRSFNRERRRY